jgi:hypothetical protein
MRASITALLFAGFTASTLALAGCGSAPADASDTGATSEALSNLGRSIVGAYERSDGAGGPTDITFNADGTYFADDVVFCIKAPCPPIRTKGAWSTTGSGTRGKLRLVPASAAPIVYGLTVAKAGAQITLATTDGSQLVEHLQRVVVTTPETCGGIAALQCPAGKECVYEGPSYPDQAGQCFPRGARGTMCGGIAGFPCDAGLTCVLTDPTIADSAGICRAPGDEGMACGGIAGLPCNAGLTCKITDTGTSDAMGVCVR